MEPQQPPAPPNNVSDDNGIPPTTFVPPATTLPEMPAGQPPAVQPPAVQEGKVKKHPPLAAQILYALGFLGLIFGLLLVVLLFVGSSTSGSSDVLSLIGLSGLTVKLAAIVMGLIIVGFFALISFIRGGKLWALITYTAFAGLGFLSEVYSLLSRSALERAFGGSNPVSDFLPYLIIGPILLILWLRNRKYFS